MSPKHRKIVTGILGLGLVVVVANPSGALPLPWSAIGARPTVDASADTDATLVVEHPSADDEPLAAPAPSDGPSQPTGDVRHDGVGATVEAVTEQHGPDAPPAPEPTTVAAANGDQAPPVPPAPGDTGGDAPAAGAEPHREPSTTAAPAGDRTPATLRLECSIRVDGVKVGAICRWSGDTPVGAARLLVLRDDGRVRLSTDNVARRDYLDGDVVAGKRYSYVVVFLDAAGRTLGHSNPSAVTMPAPSAPAPEPTPATTHAPEPATTAKPVEHPPTTTHTPEPTTTTPKPAEPAPTTTHAPEPTTAVAAVTA